MNRLRDLAGIDAIHQLIHETVFFPIKYPTLYKHLGICPPVGILLHGPSGCGKTSLALAIAGELGLPFFKVTVESIDRVPSTLFSLNQASGPELIGGTSGESEQRIRELFISTVASAPSVLVLDALDVIATSKEVSTHTPVHTYT